MFITDAELDLVRLVVSWPTAAVAISVIVLIGVLT